MQAAGVLISPKAEKGTERKSGEHAGSHCALIQQENIKYKK
jgi:hypothetical protein